MFLRIVFLGSSISQVSKCAGGILCLLTEELFHNQFTSTKAYWNWGDGGMGAWRRPKLLFLHLKNHFPIFENLWARNTQVILLSLKLFSLICSPLFPCPFSSILLRLWTEKFQRPFCPPLESILVLERLLNYPKTEAGLKHSGNT